MDGAYEDWLEVLRLIYYSSKFEIDRQTRELWFERMPAYRYTA